MEGQSTTSLPWDTKFQRNYYYCCYYYFIVPVSCNKMYWDSMGTIASSISLTQCPVGRLFASARYLFSVPEDIRVGSPLGSLFVEDPDEPQNRKTKYSIVQGEYRDTFTIEPDPSRNEGIIKPMKVRRPVAVTSDVGLGAPGFLRTQPGVAPGSEATKGARSGSVWSWPCARGHCDPGAGKGSQDRRVSALGWATPEADLEARIWV